MRFRTSQLVVKRIFDLAVSAALIVLLLPILLALSCLIRWKMGSPVLFVQQRAGWNGTPFSLLKFRTMTDQTDAAGNLKSDAQRLTPLGRFLRLTSLDELPQLLNVLRGDMSLIGPRPLLVEYLSRYTLEQQRRHDVRPGITGLAQVSGRQAIPFSERLRLDVEYVDNLSLWLDVRIVFQTAGRVFGSHGVILEQTLEEVDDIGLSQGIYQMPRFEGPATSERELGDRRRAA
jgi:sugar transferase EpsL